MLKIDTGMQIDTAVARNIVAQPDVNSDHLNFTPTQVTEEHLLP